MIKVKKKAKQGASNVLPSHYIKLDILRKLNAVATVAMASAGTTF